jgi:hypothetical protein
MINVVADHHYQFCWKARGLPALQTTLFPMGAGSDVGNLLEHRFHLIVMIIVADRVRMNRVQALVIKVNEFIIFGAFVRGGNKFIVKVHKVLCFIITKENSVSATTARKTFGEKHFSLSGRQRETVFI